MVNQSSKTSSSLLKVVKQPDVLFVYSNTVLSENEELLGVNESPIVQINWIAIDVQHNKILRESEYTIIEEVDEKANENEEDHNETKHEGLTLKEAINQVTDVIDELSVGDRTVRIVCENELHLRQCLLPRAFQKDLVLSDAFHQYYDIRKEYKLLREQSSILKCLKEIADDMIIETNDNVLSTPEKKIQFCAKVTQYLLKEGHKFSNPEHISRTLEPGMTSGYVKDDTIIRSRGLPWQVSDIDVADFFYGLNIARGGVALCLNLKGRRNGEALVRFENQEQRDLALKRHKHHLLGRYIEVYKGTAQEFLKIAKGPAGAMHAAANFLVNGVEVIIRMRGLPFEATVDDIVKFFGDLPKVAHGPDGVMLVSHPDGSSTGDAFVLFNTEAEGQEALKKHRENIGKRYVELFRSTRAELQQVLTMYNVGYHLNGPFTTQMYAPSVPTVITERALINQRLQALMNMSCLRMRGLPFSAGQKDILSFLGSHAERIVGTVHVVFNLQGRPSGEAFVQMQNPDQAHKTANDLHLKHMGERYIEVFQCSVQDMTWMLATSHANQLAAQQLNHANNNNKNNNISNNNNALSKSNKNISFHPSTPSPPPMLHTTQHSPINGLIATPPPTITTNGFLQPTLSQMPMYTTPFPPMLSPIPASFMPPPHLSPNHGVPAQLPPPMIGQVVRMRGLPYSCSLEDIHHFLKGFEYNPESVQFQMNPYGKPNGIAYITFSSPEEAHRLIHEKNRHNIGNRYVEMFIAH